MNSTARSAFDAFPDTFGTNATRYLNLGSLYFVRQCAVKIVHGDDNVRGKFRANQASPLRSVKCYKLQRYRQALFEGELFAKESFDHVIEVDAAGLSFALRASSIPFRGSVFDLMTIRLEI